MNKKILTYSALSLAALLAVGSAFLVSNNAEKVIFGGSSTTDYTITLDSSHYDSDSYKKEDYYGFYLYTFRLHAEKIIKDLYDIDSVDFDEDYWSGTHIYAGADINVSFGGTDYIAQIESYHSYDEFGISIPLIRRGDVTVDLTKSHVTLVNKTYKDAHPTADPGEYSTFKPFTLYDERSDGYNEYSCSGSVASFIENGEILQIKEVYLVFSCAK